jgi:hypothetical protein
MWKSSRNFEGRSLVINDSFGCSRGSLDLENIKFEIRSTKHETNSKLEFLNVQNKYCAIQKEFLGFGHLNFGHSDLFRISILVLRTPHPTGRSPGFDIRI